MRVLQDTRLTHINYVQESEFEKHRLQMENLGYELHYMFFEKRILQSVLQKRLLGG
mgnify:CR=1 FL=1